MANYANLEAAIQAAIYENNTNDITGAALQTVLLQMVSDMGKSGMLCNGVCDGNTVPPVAPDSNIFYIAPTGTYSNFGGLTVADGEWAIFIYNGSWQKQSVPVVTADAVPTTGSTNPVQSGGVADALEQKADIDGYYSTLTAGAAENLVGRGSVLAEYTRRTSGGSASIGSGAATIEKIHGNTIAWNQLVDAATVSYTNVGLTITATNGHYTISGTASSTSAFTLQPRINTIAGHNYYVHCVGTENFNTFKWRSISMASPYSFTFTETANTNNVHCRIEVTSGQSYSADFWYFVVDLTQAGLVGLTASEFEALFPLNYYAYNTGSLINLTATGVQTNGFNQWDGETAVGLYSNGVLNTAFTSYLSSKNKTRIFPNTTYYFHIGSNANVGRNFVYYDASENYIGDSASIYTDGAITTPANAYYANFSLGAAYGTTYRNDICINLSDTARNGEYEAYWSSTLNLPLTSVASGGSAVFADGMKSAFAVYDELTSTKAVKRMGLLDLGTIPVWYYNATYQIFYTTYGLVKSAQQNAVCTKYANPVNGSLGSMEDKTFTTRGALADHNIIIKDTSAGTDPVAFAAAMSGVYLCYELATPVEYTLDSEVNLNYRVDNLGTEAEVPQNTATPTTAPIVYDVRYAMNAVDTLRNLPTNYISKDSLKNLLDAFVSAGVISAYTMTYNAGTEQYTFTITA